MNNKFENWMNNQLAPWALTMVFGTNFIVYVNNRRFSIWEELK